MLADIRRGIAQPGKLPVTTGTTKEPTL
jgi:hypothetical protein